MSKPKPDLGGLLRPLSARSVVASVLLGSDPPALPGRLLVAFGERFGISAGTTRVALSRMLDRGELVNHDGTYALAGSLLSRKDRQDASQTTELTESWDGSWEQVVIVGKGRSAAERANLRRDLKALSLGELRDGIWMRPANLDAHRQPRASASIEGCVRRFAVAALQKPTAATLVSSLFDLDEWENIAARLETALLAAGARLGSDPAAVVDGFMLSAATLRHLVHDPQLPIELQPERWPAERLRRAFATYQARYQRVLREFFRSHAIGSDQELSVRSKLAVATTSPAT